MIVTVVDTAPRLAVTVQDGPTFRVQDGPQSIAVVTAAGPQGPAGKNGAGSPVTHTQAAPAATWLITHSLGHFPQVTVVDDAGAVVLPDVFYAALDSITVVHAAPRTGAAYLM